MNRVGELSVLMVLAVMFSAKGIQAQPITPAADGTGTKITSPSGNPDQFDITGGTQVGANLFHSLEQFGLERGQIANFLSNPQVQNILSRVVGGHSSFIDGLIQVTGGTSNLFLMNPAGIIFGSNARLNVPASFTATTANGIQIGEDWFKAIADNNYASFVDTPSSLAFTSPQLGSIINAGNLVVSPGESITLVGGTIINTGKLSAPGGTITIAAIPEEKLVRISQEDSLLSLDLPVEIKTALNAQPQPFTSFSLPQLLASPAHHATGVVVEDGLVKLTGSGITVSGKPGTIIASGTLDVSDRNIGGKGGTIDVFGDRIGLIGGTIEASGMNGGGRVRIGGTYRGEGTAPHALHTHISENSLIHADALTDGDGGQVIVWSDNTTEFYGQINARGGFNSGNGGFVEVSGNSDLTFRGAVDLSATKGDVGNLLLDPTNITIVDGNRGANDGEVTGDNQILAGDSSGATFTLSETALEALASNANVRLEATDAIAIEDLADNELTFASGTGAIAFVAGGNFSMNVGDTIRAEGRDITISGETITVGTLSTFGTTSTFQGGGRFGSADDFRFPDASGDVTLSARNDINVQRIFGKNVTLSSQNGNITTGSISSEAGSNLAAPPNSGTGSDVTLTARRGTVQLRGLIRAGQTNKTTDSTITIEAARFIATDPVSEIESDINGDRVIVNGVTQTTPINLYAYPRNVDAAANNRADRTVGTGQFVLQFEEQDPIVQGSGEPLITITLLEDTSFAVGNFDGTGSGTEGIIGLGAERAPSVIVLLRDNQFSATVSSFDSTVSDTARLVELQRDKSTILVCNPVASEGELLNVRAVMPEILNGRSQEQPTNDESQRSVQCFEESVNSAVR